MSAPGAQAKRAVVGHGSLEGYETVTLACGELDAAFAPDVGMVGVSLRHLGEELLALRHGLGAYAERAETMGIPFLHPWANRLAQERYTVGREVSLPGALPRDEHGLSIHGLLPSAWRVAQANATARSATVCATLDFNEHEAFPFPHTIDQRITLENSVLRIETVLSATGGVAVPVSFGFHPYFQLPGVPREDWVVTLPRRRHLLTDKRGIPTGETVSEIGECGPLGRRFFDDGYDALAPEAEFQVSGGGRSIGVCFHAGYPVAQLFAPLDQDVICFEPMTAPTNALVTGQRLHVLQPGGRFAAAFEVLVTPAP